MIIKNFKMFQNMFQKFRDYWIAVLNNSDHIKVSHVMLVTAVGKKSLTKILGKPLNLIRLALYLTIYHSESEYLKVFHHELREKKTMIIFVLLIEFLSASRNPSFGKITFVNGLNQMVRVHLRPSLTWTYFESRTNQTLRTNPRRHIGSNRVRLVMSIQFQSKFYNHFHKPIPFSINRVFNSALNQVVICIILYYMKMGGVIYKWLLYWTWTILFWFWMRFWWKIVCIDWSNSDSITTYSQ